MNFDFTKKALTMKSLLVFHLHLFLVVLLGLVTSSDVLLPLLSHGASLLRVHVTCSILPGDPTLRALYLVHEIIF